MLRKATYSDSPIQDPSWRKNGTSVEKEVDIHATTMDTKLGKFKYLCPSFYHTLSTSEMVCLNLNVVSPTTHSPDYAPHENLNRETEREGVSRELIGNLNLGAHVKTYTTPILSTEKGFTPHVIDERGNVLLRGMEKEVGES